MTNVDIPDLPPKTSLATIDKFEVSSGGVSYHVESQYFPISILQQAALDLKQNSLGFTPENAANKNAASGYAGLSGGLLDLAQIPNLPESRITNLVADLAAKESLLPSKVGNALKFLRVNATENGFEYAAGGGSGIASINGDTTPAQLLVQQANKILIASDLAGNHTFTIGTDIVTLTGAQALTTKTMVLASNTFTDTSAALGDIIKHNGTKFVRFGIGSANQQIRVNAGGTDLEYFTSSAGAGDMILASAQTNSGIKTFLDTTMKLRNVANTFDGYFVNTNTADRIYALPDASGTVTLIALAQALTNKTIDADLNTISNIENADIKALAGIVYSKLNLTGAILNTDLAGSIAYSKLVLTGAILNADLAGGITVAKLANGTDGELITWDASGVASTVAVGTAGQVLTSNGAGAAPTFQAAAGGGGGKSIVGVGRGIITLAGTVIYHNCLGGILENDSVETDRNQAIPIAGTLKRAVVKINSNASTTNGVLTLRKGGVDTTIVITITALTTGTFSDLTNTVTVAALDLLNWKSAAGTTGNIFASGVSMEFDPS